MDTMTEKLTQWAIQKIRAEYPDDVALLVAVEGHSVNGDGHGECFDYFIPATERGNELAQTFIIDGIGTDLYPRSWERTERTAELDDRSTICLGNARIVYSRSREDTERFEAIRRKLFENLASQDFIYKKALENLNIAMDIYRSLMFEDALYKLRMAAGYIGYYLSLSVMYLNGTYYKDLRYGRLPELQALRELPDSFLEYCSAIISAETGDELKNLSYLLIRTTRRFIALRKAVRKPEGNDADFQSLAGWYQELSLTWRRIRYYCSIGNADAAFTDACNLQSELLIVGEEFGLREMDLLGAFDARELSRLSKRSEELEEYIVSEIEVHGVKLNRYATMEEFLSKN